MGFAGKTVIASRYSLYQGSNILGMQMLAIETFPALHAQDKRLGRLAEDTKDKILTSAEVSSLNREQRYRAARNHWEVNIVDPYLKCVLTKPEDKLIAISALPRSSKISFRMNILQDYSGRTSHTSFCGGLWVTSKQTVSLQRSLRSIELHLGLGHLWMQISSVASDYLLTVSQ